MATQTTFDTAAVSLKRASLRMLLARILAALDRACASSGDGARGL